MKKIIILLFLTGFAFGTDISPKSLEEIQSVSVTVDTEKSSGSGIVISRTSKNETLNFVLTAAHVVKKLKKSKKVIDKNGSTKTSIDFSDAKIIKTLIEEDRTVGHLEIFSEVIKYDAEEDIALLRIRQKNFLKKGVRFYLEDKPPIVGTNIWHCGSLLGVSGASSITSGLISQDGRVFDKRVCTQLSCSSFPGGSGGGIFLQDARLIGQLTSGRAETFVFMTPIRRIIKWANDKNLNWIYDDKIVVPSDEELKKIPVEDNGEVEEKFIFPFQFIYNK